jgi:serine phosphatase RsbU (regulator of sigma subunit)/anti-sigma regulatory factor (Ser/Thr protein kinase)
MEPCEHNALRFLERADLALSALDEPRKVFERLAALLVPELADLCAVWIADRGAPRALAVRHADPALETVAAELLERYPLAEGDPLGRALNGAEPVLCERIGPAALDELARDDAHRALLDRLGARSAVLVPIAFSDGARGLVALASGGERRLGPTERSLLGILARRVAAAYEADQLRAELARRAAVAIENAQMYRREKRIADEVQRALLPTALPDVPGYAFDAVYSPSERDVEVGGDWFDAFALPDGRVVISIGDVFGHGLHASVVMSSIRHGLRLLALQQSQPDRMLHVVDEALARDYPEASASAVVAVLDPAAQTLTYAVAGHPSPLLRAPDGEVHALRGNGVPLGVRGGITPNVQTVALPLGAMLVLYTDGLVEATRGDALDAEQRVRGALRDETLVRDAHPAERIKRCVLERGGADDVAVLTVRVRSSIPLRAPGALPPQWVFRADDARSAEDARAGFIAFLKTRGVPDANYAAAELVFGELIGNVVRHAPGPITIELDWEKDDPVLHVIDRGRAFDVKASLPDDVMSESGRGLFLVSVLTDDFAVTSLPDYGNHTRVKLRIERLDEIAR